jgi:hypothetical protein
VGGRCHGARQTERQESTSFLKKRSKKLLIISASVLQERPKPNSQSFLVLIFKKEPLSAACLGPALAQQPGTTAEASLFGLRYTSR